MLQYICGSQDNLESVLIFYLMLAPGFELRSPDLHRKSLYWLSHLTTPWLNISCFSEQDVLVNGR